MVVGWDAMRKDGISHAQRIEVSDEMSPSVLGWVMKSSRLALSTTSLQICKMEQATIPSPQGCGKNKDCQAMDGKAIRAALGL